MKKKRKLLTIFILSVLTVMLFSEVVVAKTKIRIITDGRVLYGYLNDNVTGRYIFRNLPMTLLTKNLYFR